MRVSDVVFFFLIPLFYCYCAILSKLLPETGVWWIDVVARDRYYVLLIPLMLPVLVFFVFCNWMGLKYFRAN
jgi:hypothetical protein